MSRTNGSQYHLITLFSTDYAKGIPLGKFVVIKSNRGYASALPIQASLNP